MIDPRRIILQEPTCCFLFRRLSVMLFLRSGFCSSSDRIGSAFSGVMLFDGSSSWFSPVDCFFSSVVTTEFLSDLLVDLLLMLSSSEAVLKHEPPQPYNAPQERSGGAPQRRRPLLNPPFRPVSIPTFSKPGITRCRVNQDFCESDNPKQARHTSSL